MGAAPKAAKRCANCGETKSRRWVKSKNKWFCCQACAKEFSRAKVCEFC